MNYIGYINYVVLLLLVTGLLIIRFDVKAYQMAGMKKEKRAARFLGWFNLSLGIIIFGAHWVYDNWFW